MQDMDGLTRERLIGWAEEYNDPKYFEEDPIIFPKRMAELYRSGKCGIADVEIAAIIAAHLAWGRRAMIVRDCGRALEEMDWKPYDYVMRGKYRDEDASLHRTVKWSEFARICSNLKQVYSGRSSIEGMGNSEIRCSIYGRKEDRAYRIPRQNRRLSRLFGNVMVVAAGRRRGHEAIFCVRYRRGL